VYYAHCSGIGVDAVIAQVEDADTYRGSGARRVYAFLKQFVDTSFSQIRSELKRIAPQADLGDRSGPITGPSLDPGIEMLSVNGETMSVLVINGPAPASVFRPREIEYAPAQLDPSFRMPHAYFVSEHLLRSGKRLSDGETIGVDGQIGFTVVHADKCVFCAFPVARLSVLPKIQ
jgi:hypothetical protein